MKRPLKKITKLYAIPYFLWILLFVILPVCVLFIESIHKADGGITFAHYQEFFTSKLYLQLTLQSILYSLIITSLTLMLSYPTAYFLQQCKHKDLWLMFIILPTWVNLLLKAYAFMGILAKHGSLNQILQALGLQETSLLFTATGFIIVATYIELPFMIMPIYTALEKIPHELIQASYDLGATKRQTFRHVIWPLSLSGVKSGIQAVFIPTLSLFMLTRLISGNRVMTLGSAIEQHFLVTQDWEMGSTIGIILIGLMFSLMLLTKRDSRET